MVKQLRKAALLLLVASSALSGCLFSPEKKPPIIDPPATYPVPVTPYHALANMITAYQERDSVQTRLVYADGYSGSSSDLTKPTPVPLTFTKEDEVRHIVNLKSDPNIVSVRLDFGPQVTWIESTPDAGDPPNWKVLQINGASIEIQDIGSSTTWASSNNPMVYTFQPSVDSEGRTIYQIVRWEEIRN